MQAPVDLWTVSLAKAGPVYLSDEEAARAGRFKFDEDRTRWTRARSSLRLILSKYAGDDPLRLAFVYGEHGKPALAHAPGVEFNLSHAGEWALVAVTHGMTHGIPVGVDIERIRPKMDMAPLLRRLGESDLPGTTQELYQRWTRREAISKAAGGALFDKPADNIRAVKVRAPEEGYAASLALAGYEPEVRYCKGGGSL